MEKIINERIAKTKRIVEKITKHFHYSPEIIDILTISYLSIIMLDDEIEDLLMEVLSKTYLLFSNLPVVEIYQKLTKTELEDATIAQLEKDNSAYFGSYINDNKLESENLVIIGPANKHYQIFDNVIHEVKHAINEVLPEFCQGSNPSFYSGLAMETKNNIYYQAIDEAFNSYLTKLYLDNINILKAFNIEDKGINNLLQAFKLPKTYHYAYERITKLCLPLFKSTYLFKSFYYSSLYKSFYELDRRLHLVFGKTMDSTDFFFYLDKLLDNNDLEPEIENLDYTYLRSRVKIKPYLK